MYDLFEEMSKLFGNLDEVSNTLTNAVKYSVPSFPPVRVVQREKKVTLKFALAGYTKNDVEISFKKDCLILSTTSSFNKKEAAKEKGTKVLVDNFKTPSFSYKYFIPENMYDFEKTEATFADGVLTIVIPAREKIETKTTKIEIK